MDGVELVDSDFDDVEGEEEAPLSNEPEEPEESLGVLRESVR